MGKVSEAPGWTTEELDDLVWQAARNYGMAWVACYNGSVAGQARRKARLERAVAHLEAILKEYRQHEQGE